MKEVILAKFGKIHLVNKEEISFEAFGAIDDGHPAITKAHIQPLAQVS